jgi:3-oxocholest-4-en-26-oate---CoA ligase
MHGAAQWAASINLCTGRPFVMAPTTTHFDPTEVWALAGRERVISLSIVGDAFGRPSVEALESADYDLSGLLVLVTGGVALR